MAGNLTPTPGPWFWAENADGDPVALMDSPRGLYVATSQRNGDANWVDVTEADARLIEAAPDHLDVLRVIAAGGCDIETARMLARLAVRRFEAVTP